MRKLAFLVVVGISLLEGQALPARTAASTVETHEAMVHWINPAMLAIWDTIDAARINADGSVAVQLDGASWATLQSAAHSLEYSSRRMARARVLSVGAHTAEVPGFATKAEIQAKLNSNPNRFRALSSQMANRAAALRTAAEARDTLKMIDLVDELNTSCQSCHTLYWNKPHL